MNGNKKRGREIWWVFFQTDLIWVKEKNVAMLLSENVPFLDINIQDWDILWNIKTVITVFHLIG